MRVVERRDNENIQCYVKIPSTFLLSDETISYLLTALHIQNGTMTSNSHLITYLTLQLAEQKLYVFPFTQTLFILYKL